MSKYYPQTQKQIYSWNQGPYDYGSNPHWINQPDDIHSAVGWFNTWGFYSTPSGEGRGGLLPTGATMFPFSYPTVGYPNPYAYETTTPAGLSFSFNNRPFL